MKKTIFFGSSNFSIPFIEYLNSKTSIQLVITTEDKPKDRGKKLISNSVKSYVQGKNLSVISPPSLKDPMLIKNISNIEPDLIFVASYGKLIPLDILQIPKFGAYNIHPSILPFYKGAEPIFWQLARGERKSGVTLFEMNDKIDQGDIIFQENAEISEDDNYLSLEEKLIKIALNITGKMIDYLENDTPLPHTVQEKINTFYARKIDSKDENVLWNDHGLDIINKIRAFAPRIGVYTLFKGKRIKILKAYLENLQNEYRSQKPGTIIINGKKLLVKCLDALIRVESLKPEGKDLIKSIDFINGYIKDNSSNYFE